MKPKSRKLKLRIELVPSTSWYNNLRTVLSQHDWDKIRKKAYVNYGHRCGICRNRGKLNCHEIWDYDDNNYIQKLVGFITLCTLCHHIKHIGLAQILASEGKLEYKEIIKHFMKVNNCDDKAFKEHKESAFNDWEKRSKHQWTLDLGEYKPIIELIKHGNQEHSSNSKNSEICV